jgi:hypothetical protein
MKTLMKPLQIVSIFLCATVSLNAQQPRLDADARARAIAPFLDAQVVAIARLDLNRIDPDALVDKVAALGKMDALLLAEPKKELARWLQPLTRAGAKEVYALFSLASDPLEIPVMVIPLGAGADGKAIAESLRKDGTVPEAVQVGQAVVAGSKNGVQRFRELKPVARPEVVKAFTAAGDSTFQFLLLPTGDLRRALEEALPNLPREIGATTKTFTRGIDWIALGLDITPKSAINVVVQATDAATAQQLNKAIPLMFLSLAPDANLPKSIPSLNNLIAIWKPKLVEDRLVLAVDESQMATLIRDLGEAPKAARSTRSMNHLREIGIAMHNYHEAQNTLPTQASLDKQNKPLLSWRVHLLPFLNEGELYKQFRLDEPWDSEHNKKLIEQMPRVYRGGNAMLNAAGKTTFLAPACEGMVFRRGGKGLTLAEIVNADGASNTIAVVDADDDQAVVWTRPDDLTIDAKQPLKGLGAREGGGFLALFVDASVQLIPKGKDPAKVSLLFRYNSGQQKMRP